MASIFKYCPAVIVLMQFLYFDYRFIHLLPFLCCLCRCLNSQGQLKRLDGLYSIALRPLIESGFKCLHTSNVCCTLNKCPGNLTREKTLLCASLNTRALPDLAIKPSPQTNGRVTTSIAALLRQYRVPFAAPLAVIAFRFSPNGQTSLRCGAGDRWPQSP
jgi:hypothetical protein